MATIVKLPDSTIQMIAAGEVITRPINVIKELLENSLDAGSTNIRLIIEQGGVKLIEIIDNGHGIARSDAELLCCRYATSKLSSADDLTRISTFGFRGEALASISEMADLEVRTFNMKSDKQGWQAKYKCGKLVGQPADKYLQNPGTQLRVTNLFSTTQQRRIAMQASFIEEKKLIVGMVMRYAIHHRDKVTMSLKESNSPDLICVIAPMSIKPCIGMFFGLDMEYNLSEFSVENSNQYKVEAHIVFSYKKPTGSYNHSNFIIFVNNRLVECSDLKREVEALLCEYLDTKQHVSLFCITLKVPPCDVDVNMHPAKATVALHYQAEIIALLVTSLRVKLKETLVTQSMPSTTYQRITGQLVKSPLITHSASSSITPAKRQWDLVHNDFSQQKLADIPVIGPKRTRRDLRLRSICELRQQVAREKSKDNARTIKNSVFVGLFDHDRALIQHETKLYAINLKAFLKEQYYQFYLFDLGNFSPIEILPPGNKIKFIIDTYFEDIRKHDENNFHKLKFKTTQKIIDELMKHSAMFEDYLAFKCTKDEILTLPCIMPDEVPNLTFLGKFLVDLVNKVDYTEERDCLRMIGRVLAEFYSEPPVNLKDRDVHKGYHDLVESKLYIAIKNYLLIPEWLFTRENICQISDTKDLYRVFERC